MRTVPIFVDLDQSRVVVVGGGEQVLQKVRLLLKTPARIEVFCENLEGELHELAASGQIAWHRQFDPIALDGCRLVYAAADAATNAAVARRNLRKRSLRSNGRHIDLSDFTGSIHHASAGI